MILFGPAVQTKSFGYCFQTNSLGYWLRSATIACRRLRSVGLRWTVTPVRIPQTKAMGIPTRTLASASIR